MATRSAANLPGPKSSFPFGSFFDFLKNAPEFLTRQVRDYGGISQFKLAFKNFVVIADPELVRHILVTDAKSYAKAPLGVTVLKRGLGQGLVTSQGSLHTQQRKLVQPAFQHKRVKYYGNCIAEHTQRILAQWQCGDIREVDSDMHRLSMSIVSESLFGARLSEDDFLVGRSIDRLQQLAIRSIFSLLPIPFWVPTPNHIEVRYQRRVLNKVVHKIIADRQRDNIDRGDLLSALLFSEIQEAERMSTQQLRDEVVTLFAAGHETTANALTWTLLFMSEHPKIQARMQKEVDALLSGRQVNSDDIENLPLTAAVFNESLRLRPTAWALAARQSRADTVIDGFAIDKKWILFICPYAMHRNPQYFDNPDNFDPDRWIDGRTDKLPRLAYLPFGAGPHVCIGNQLAIQEGLMVLAAIVQRFELQPESTSDTVKPLPLITLTPEGSVRLKIRRRPVV